MRLNVPIACFNLGAPAERIARYPLGRVIERIDPVLAVGDLVALARRADELAATRLDDVGEPAMRPGAAEAAPARP